MRIFLTDGYLASRIITVFGEAAENNAATSASRDKEAQLEDRQDGCPSELHATKSRIYRSPHIKKKSAQKNIPMPLQFRITLLGIIASGPLVALGMVNSERICAAFWHSRKVRYSSLRPTRSQVGWQRVVDAHLGLEED